MSSIEKYALPLNSAAFSSASICEVYKKSKNVPSIRNYDIDDKIHSNLLWKFCVSASKMFQSSIALL